MIEPELLRYLYYLTLLNKLQMLPAEELRSACGAFIVTGKNSLPSKLQTLGYNNESQYHLTNLAEQRLQYFNQNPRSTRDYFVCDADNQRFVESLEQPPIRRWYAELKGSSNDTSPHPNANGETLVHDPSQQHSQDSGFVVTLGPTVHQSPQSKPRFELTHSPLDKGGQGVIYRAYDSTLNRYVAVKKLKPFTKENGHHDNEEHGKRLLAEARITARLQHPNIIQVYDVDENEESPSFAMQLLQDSEGNKTQTYHDLIKQHHALNIASQAGERRANLRRLLEQLVIVCRSIHYAHTQGVIHRDLKPSNILCGQHGDIQVIDWGLAKLTHHRVWTSLYETERMSPEAIAQPETPRGSMFGSPLFMSPEQFLGNSNLLTKSTDIYSLGVTLYFMLAEQYPCQAQNEVLLAEKVRNGDFSPPSKYQTEIDPGLEAICMLAMQKDPEKRYLTAGEFADDLQRWLDGERPHAFHESRWQTLKRWFTKRPEYQVVLAMLAYINPILFVTICISIPVSFLGTLNQKIQVRDLNMVSGGLMIFVVFAALCAQLGAFIGFGLAGMRYFILWALSTTSLDRKPPDFEARAWVKKGFMAGFISYPLVQLLLLINIHVSEASFTGFKVGGGTPRSLLMLDACSAIYATSWIAALVWILRRASAAAPVERPQVTRKVYNAAWLSLLISSPLSTIVILLIYFFYTPNPKDYEPIFFGNTKYAKSTDNSPETDQDKTKQDPKKSSSGQHAP